jgi:hypothetical protein
MAHLPMARLHRSHDVPQSFADCDARSRPPRIRSGQLSCRAVTRCGDLRVVTKSAEALEITQWTTERIIIVVGRTLRLPEPRLQQATLQSASRDTLVQ